MGGRTSVLSRRWLLTWTSMPDIIARQEPELPGANINLARKRFSNMVSRIFSNHLGHLEKFHLESHSYMPANYDHWFFRLSLRDVKCIELRLTCNPKYRVSMALF